jgi:hypothetical protein
MWSTLPTFYANEGTWVLNRATLGTIRKFKDNNNQYSGRLAVSVMGFAGLPRDDPGPAVRRDARHGRDRCEQVPDHVRQLGARRIRSSIASACA